MNIIILLSFGVLMTSGFEIKPHRPEVWALEGKEVIFTCLADDKVSTCTWKNPKANVFSIGVGQTADNGRIAFHDTTDANHCSIKIAQTMESDFGNWTCNVAHASETGETTTLTSPIALLMAIEPTFVRLEPKSIFESPMDGNAKQMTCYLAGNATPAPEFSWYIGGEDASNYVRVKTIVDTINEEGEWLQTISYTPKRMHENKTIGCSAKHMTMVDLLEDSAMLSFVASNDTFLTDAQAQIKGDQVVANQVKKDEIFNQKEMIFTMVGVISGIVGLVLVIILAVGLRMRAQSIQQSEVEDLEKASTTNSEEDKKSVKDEADNNKSEASNEKTEQSEDKSEKSDEKTQEIKDKKTYRERIASFFRLNNSQEVAKPENEVDGQEDVKENGDFVEIDIEENKSENGQEEKKDEPEKKEKTTRTAGFFNFLKKFTTREMTTEKKSGEENIALESKEEEDKMVEFEPEEKEAKTEDKKTEDKKSEDKPEEKPEESDNSVEQAEEAKEDKAQKPKNTDV